MVCEHFGQCGGCQINASYSLQLEQKVATYKQLFAGLVDDISVFSSPPEAFRARAEFRLHTQADRVYLSMNTYGKNNRVKITSCPIILPHLMQKLSLLLESINAQDILKHKLYGIKILGSLSGESLITLIYRHRLDERWAEIAFKQAQELSCHIIGRSKGQKYTLTQDFICETLKIHQKEYFYIQKEGAFSQPNPYINIQMIGFILSYLETTSTKDLLEMYCGSGNFTIPLAKHFRKVFATEIVKSSIQTLCSNAMHNQITHITPARLSGAETIAALNFEREFFRLKGIDLRAFDFSHVLIDPPRSGIGDVGMLQFIGGFRHIIYISCNPLTLAQDLNTLLKTHYIEHCAFFDQFPYTHHLECIVLMKRIQK
ncbi:tRNA (uridine(54)-C5)-methyltransferase TrmA [Helicobacter sp. 12S02634-8]|nr:tRNA (uridine(54)-C5)-methyltransferase TrmA [Helicobacter sp. 12S02634-8]